MSEGVQANKLGKGKIKKHPYKMSQAAKNSSWQLFANIIAKMGSLAFTIVIARILEPEIYGLYALAISTILFLGLFSDLGLFSTFITFISKNIDEKPRLSKRYANYLTKLKFFLVFFSSFMLLILSKWISSYYNKPIFYALLAGIIYIPCSSFFSWVSNIFIAKNKFNVILIKELIFQFLRLTIVPLSIIFILKDISNNYSVIVWIILMLSICYLIAIIFTVIKSRRSKFSKIKDKEKLSNENKKEIFKFALPLGITALASSFYGYIDVIMLGHYVDPSHIAYYQAALNLINSASMILAFMGIALLPIFSRLSKADSKELFRRSRLVLFTISICALVFTILTSKYLILIVYGDKYFQSIVYLQIFSIMLLFVPIIELYVNYYMANKRTNIIAISLITSTILNVILNFVFIGTGLLYGMDKAVLGACMATITSRFVYISLLSVLKKVYKL